MTFPGTILSQLYNVASSFRQLQTNAGLNNFVTYLGQQPLIRLFVDGSPGRGHQTSSVRILRKLAGEFAYAGTIEVAYRGGGRTLGILQLLIPELHGGTEGTIGQATVQLVAYPVSHQAPVVAVGFTGGADGDENFATGLRASTFLRLQPYNWTRFEDQIQWDSSEWPYLDLRQQNILGGTSFLRRAYSMPAPGVPDWGAYAGGEYQDRLAVLEWLLGQIGADVDLCVTTGIRTGRSEIGKPSEVVFNLITGLLASQRDGARTANGAKPVVVVNLDNLDDAKVIDSARRLLGGGIGEADYAWLESRGDQACGYTVEKRHQSFQSNICWNAWRARKVWVCQADVTAAARACLEVQGVSLDVVQQKIAWLTQGADRVLFLPIGPVPPAVFDYVFSRSTLPTVFEGQSSANLALTLGNPYFHVQQKDHRTGGSQYPSTSLGSNNFDPAASEFQTAANQINAGITSWSADYNPAVVMGAFIKKFREENADDPLHAYLAAVKNFYAPPQNGGWAANDKFVMAAGFLNYVINGRGTPELPAATGGADVLLADPPNPLPDLHKKLCANLDGGKLDLLPGVFASGPIFDFYKMLGLPLLGVGGVTIDPGCDDPSDAIDKITLTGSTDSWTAAGTTLELSIEFTAPQGEIVMAATFRVTGSWSPDGMQWIVLENPFVRIETTGAAMPTVGKVGGTIKNVGTFALTFPVAEGKWLFGGAYDPVLSPERVFQLAGGMNLSSALPVPVSGFTTLGASSTELLYDSSATVNKVEYVTVVIETAEPWPLLPGLSLEALKAVVTVGEPTGRRKLTADLGASFTIPGGTQSALISADAQSSAKIAVSASYPGGKLAGKLQSGVITFDGLVGIFWPGSQPPLPALPSITGFSAEIDTATKDYSVNCDLNIDWSIAVGGTEIFAVSSLSFWLSCVKQSVSGKLVGTVLIGKSLVGDDVVVELSAAYAGGESKSWTFAGRQASGVLYLDTLVKRFLGQGWDTGGNGTLGIQDIAFEVETGTGSYSLSGGTTTWKIEFLDNLEFSATLELHHAGKADKTAQLNAPSSTNDVPALPPTELGRLRAEAGKGLSGKISAQIQYKFIDISVYYAFAEEPAKSEFGFEWGKLSGTVAKNDKQQWVGTLNLKSFSIGGMVETMVSWATGQPYGLVAPWTFLNDISLKGLDLTFNFTTNEVGLSIDIGLDVGFAKIDKFTITYKPDQQGSPVEVALDGSFFWVVDGGAEPPEGTTVTKDKVAWDATKPDNTPAPSGGGNKYLDLRLLALGQHIAISDAEQFESVEEVMTALRKVKLPASGCLVPVDANPAPHQLMYDDKSSWLIAASFGVLKVEKKKDDTPEESALKLGGNDE